MARKPEHQIVAEWEAAIARDEQADLEKERTAFQRSMAHDAMVEMMAFLGLDVVYSGDIDHLKIYQRLQTDAGEPYVRRLNGMSVNPPQPRTKKVKVSA